MKGLRKAFAPASSQSLFGPRVMAPMFFSNRTILLPDPALPLLFPFCQALVTIPAAMAQALSQGHTEAIGLTLELWSPAHTLLSSHPLLLLAPHLLALAQELRSHSDRNVTASSSKGVVADSAYTAQGYAGEAAEARQGRAAGAPLEDSAEEVPAGGQQAAAWCSNSYVPGASTDALADIEVASGLQGSCPSGGTTHLSDPTAQGLPAAGDALQSVDGGDSLRAFLQDLAQWLHYSDAASFAAADGAAAGKAMPCADDVPLGVASGQPLLGPQALPPTLGLPAWASAHALLHQAATLPELQQGMRSMGCDLVRHAVRHGMRGLASLIWQRLCKPPFQVPVQELLEGPGLDACEDVEQVQEHEDASVEGGLLHLAAAGCAADADAGMLLDVVR